MSTPTIDLRLQIAYAPVRAEAGSGGENWTAAESAGLGRLRSPKRRSEWMAGRRAAKSALASLWAEVCGRPARPAELEILAHATGAPELRVENFGVSIAHSDQLAVAVVWYSRGSARLGVDLERIRPLDFEITQMFCSTDEIRELRDLPAAAQDVAILRLWTAKEAIYKAQFPNAPIDLRSALSTPHHAVHTEVSDDYVVSLAVPTTVPPGIARDLVRTRGLINQLPLNLRVTWS